MLRNTCFDLENVEAKQMSNRIYIIVNVLNIYIYTIYIGTLLKLIVCVK